MRHGRGLAALVAAFLVLPGVASAHATPRQWDPLTPPDDVTALVAVMSESVVQVQCGDKLSTGWSIAVGLSEEAQRRGYRSMIITDAESLRDCRTRSTRNVEIRYLGAEFTGYVWSWDEGQPFIAVAMKARVPMLPWARIARPVEGQWVGSVTSEGGNGAAFAEGRVTTVALKSLTTTLELSGTRVGSPIFDSQGNVLAMTAYRNAAVTEAGGPELCMSVVKCQNQAAIWVIFTIPRAVRSPEAAALRGGVKVTWQSPLGADAAGPVDYYEYRVGSGEWRRTTRTSVVIKPLPRGRVATVEVRAVNQVGAGASIFVRATPL